MPRPVSNPQCEDCNHSKSFHTGQKGDPGRGKKCSAFGCRCIGFLEVSPELTGA